MRGARETGCVWSVPASRRQTGARAPADWVGGPVALRSDSGRDQSSEREFGCHGVVTACNTPWRVAARPERRGDISASLYQYTSFNIQTL